MKRIIVIGGGFSGLIAGIFAKKDNNEVIILERNNNCGKKILVTGNGRCNYSNQDQDIKHYHTSSNINLDSIINQDNVSKILDFYYSIGIYPRIKNGYYYPFSNQAVTVLNFLINKCNEKGIIIVNNTLVTKINKEDGIFYIDTDNKEYTCDKVIIACGSKAYPKLGTDGIGYQLLKSLGHSIIPVFPALTGIKTVDNTKDIAGVRSEVSISLYENDKFIKKEIGEIQFTDYGISGICSMQLSHIVSRGLSLDNNYMVKINFVYDLYNSNDELASFLESIRNNSIHNILDSFLNYKVTNYILKKNHIDGNLLWSYLDNSIKDIIINDLTNFELNVNGTNSFEQAQICTGGVNLSEINISTMESKLVDNLYIVGEILDVDGDCGGYNITFASISGMLAGIEAGKND